MRIGNHPVPHGRAAVIPVIVFAAKAHDRDAHRQGAEGRKEGKTKQKRDRTENAAWEI